MARKPRYYLPDVPCHVGGFKSEVQHLLTSKVRACRSFHRGVTSNFSLKSA
jgi:hypothetical protein